MKTCSKCKIEKPLSEFYKDKYKRDGLSCACKMCKDDHSKIVYAQNKEKIAEYNKNYQKVNKQRLNKVSKDYYHSNKEKHKDGILKRVYGITLDEYNQMIEDQNGICVGCGRPFYGTGTQGLAPCVDHDHSTGKVRGIIHQTCNKALGLTYDDPEVLENLAQYLRRDKL